MAKKKGVITSTSNTIVELADATSEFAESIRRGFKITNTMLKQMESEIFMDAIQELVNRGLTTQEAILQMESV